MRWRTVKPVPKHGEIRTRHKFAWRPTEVEDHTVWLEFYRITERYIDYRTEHEIPGYWHQISKNLLYVMY